MTSLPRVAQSLPLHCKACGQETYHRVLTHVSLTEAKMECERCHRKSSYKVGVKITATRIGSGGVRKPTAPKETWPEVRKKMLMKTARKYVASEVFAKEDVVEHPDFGLGSVLNATPSRIEVQFEEGKKTLVHGMKN